jgi:predicted enzyme related to lactoylglutathione lyase
VRPTERAGATNDEAGIPATTFAADDVRAEYERMKQLGVVFTAEPAETGGVIGAVFDDTCGNLIGLHQVLAWWRPALPSTSPA